VELLPQVPQIEALHIDFIANFVISNSVREALKSLTKLKKVWFSVSCEYLKENLEVLEFLEDCPLENLDFRVLISKNESIISGISDFLLKKKDLKTLGLRVANRYAFENLKYVEDLFRVVNELPKLTSFSILTTLDPGNRRGYSCANLTLPEGNLSFDKMFSRPIHLKKFRISLAQHSFSKKGFMKLLAGLQKFSSTLEKLRIDVGEYKPRTKASTDIIINFIKSPKHIRFLKLYSLDISTKAFF